jgi:hypothetical protein
VASVAGPKAGVAEEARTRSFAAPAFAGCAFVVLGYLEGQSTLRAGTGYVKRARVSKHWLNELRLDRYAGWSKRTPSAIDTLPEKPDRSRLP